MRLSLSCQATNAHREVIAQREVGHQSSIDVDPSKRVIADPLLRCLIENVLMAHRLSADPEQLP